MLLIYTLLGIVALIILIAYFKVDTFISFMLVSLSIGLISGIEIKLITKAVQDGIGDTLADLTLIIGFGAMLGKIVADSGAAQKITGAMVKLFGEKYLQWALAFAGLIIGIPLFYNAGFIIVLPLIFTIAHQSKLPILYLAIPMLSALSVAHGYLPPHPSPIAISAQLGASISTTLFYGLIISIPAIALAGPVFGKTLKKYNPKINKELFGDLDKKVMNPPGLYISMFISLLPIFLLTGGSILKSKYPGSKFIEFIAEPYVGMLISVLAALYFLGIRRGEKMQDLSKSLESSFKAIAPILLIIAGAGALKQIFIASGVSHEIGGKLASLPINPLVLGWAIAAIIRVCVGSATVSGLTTVGILGPSLIESQAVSPELMVLSIGAGSLMFSHLNDSGFWMFKEYFNLSIKETIKTWSIMETIVSVVGLFGVLIINLFI